jgi:uncharacterized membrane protein YbhN (UPF0104 family)
MKKIKILFSIIILSLIFYKFGTKDVFSHISSLPILHLLTATLLYVFAIFLMGIRFFYCTPLTFSKAISVTWIGSMFNQIMPSSIGGDVYRIVSLAPYVSSKKEALLKVLLDRTLGLMGLGICFVYGLVFLFYRNVIPLYMFGYCVLTLAFLCCLLFVRKIRRFFFFLLKHFCSYINFHMGLITIVSSILIQISCFIVARSLSLNLDLCDVCIIVPLTSLASLLPISFAGWGVRESISVFILNYYQINSSLALSFSIIIGLISILASLPGIIFYIASNTKMKNCRVL